MHVFGCVPISACFILYKYRVKQVRARLHTNKVKVRCSYVARYVGKFRAFFPLPPRRPVQSNSSSNSLGSSHTRCNYCKKTTRSLATGVYRQHTGWTDVEWNKLPNFWNAIKWIRNMVLSIESHRPPYMQEKAYMHVCTHSHVAYACWPSLNLLHTDVPVHVISSTPRTIETRQDVQRHR